MPCVSVLKFGIVGVLIYQMGLCFKVVPLIAQVSVQFSFVVWRWPDLLFPMAFAFLKAKILSIEGNRSPVQMEGFFLPLLMLKAGLHGGYKSIKIHLQMRSY